MAQGIEGLPDLSRSAKGYGTLVTAELERAEVMGEPVLAICVDHSKAYNMVRLDHLEYRLEGNGMPREVWQPMPDRALRQFKAIAGSRGRTGARLWLRPWLPGRHLRRGPLVGQVATRRA